MFPDDYTGRVFVYFDLHHQCWSIRSCKTGRLLNMEETAGKRQKVVVHLLCLRDCVFAVQRAARERALQAGVRTVHAGVYGYLARPEPSKIATLCRRVRYSWRERGEFFIALTGQALMTAPLALFSYGGVYIEE